MVLIIYIINWISSSYLDINLQKIMVKRVNINISYFCGISKLLEKEYK